MLFKNLSLLFAAIALAAVSASPVPALPVNAIPVPQPALVRRMPSTPPAGHPVHNHQPANNQAPKHPAIKPNPNGKHDVVDAVIWLLPDGPDGPDSNDPIFD
ncbi:hypothetical protein GQ54DRAFT_295894 [Martensiomyces pterosporus]|nr:hypothetical protein GQ54DRAFT_295894 [Martensiomyces pterosporus]